MRLLIVLGGGGHTTEMLKLVDLLGPDYEYHYLLVKEVNFSGDRIQRKGQVHEVRRPRGRHDGVLASIVNSIIALVQITIILINVRPKAVIGCGPAVSVLVSVAGKLVGAKVIHIETGSRVNALSGSGRIVYSLADLFLVQWPALKEEYPRAIYAGRL
jgi:beta-1,4-N-acetylglucosaminyltransferase